MRKAAWIVGILLLLGLFGFWQLNNQSPQEVTGGKNSGEYQLISKINLGNVEVKSFKTMSFTKEELAFSPDSKYLAVGTEGGTFFLFDLTKGKIAWEKKLGVGAVTALTFSPDGKQVFLGEKSPEGNLYCFNTANGQLLWKMSVVQDLGRDLTKKLFPQIARLKVDQQGNLYVSALRFVKNSQSTWYESKIYCLNIQDGKPKWTFPAQGVADFWANWLAVSPTGDRLVFGTANYSTTKPYHYPAHLYCLDSKTGEEIWQKTIPVLPGEKVVTTRYGPNFSLDGKYLALFPSDGRAFFLDQNGKTLWQKDICLPQEIQGVTFNSGGRYAHFLGEQIVFASTNTYNSHNWKEATPVEHPNSNTIFAYNPQGELLWKWKGGGSMEELDFNDRYLLVPVGRNVQLEEMEVHGLYLLDYLKKGSLVYRYPTEGPAVGAALAPNSRYLACLEAPIQLDDGVTVVGKHQLHILERR